VRYELFFVSDILTAPEIAFEQFFRERPFYTMARQNARYLHPDTGVEFTFECTAEPTLPPGTARPWARFVIELLRPSFFADEATREIEPFVRHFDSRQVEADGLSTRPYSPAAFLRGWHEASRREYGRAQAMAEGSGAPLSRMPRAQLRMAWQWNYHRAVLQAHEGEELFVPRIWFLRGPEGMATSLIWPEAMAARVPQVDYVLFSRGAFDAGRGKTSDVALVPWSDIAPVIAGSATYDSLFISWRVTDPASLETLVSVVSRHPPARALPDLVPLDAVLDAEGFPDSGG
jgi:hypothetical protein